jgi:hypothetical protein
MPSKKGQKGKSKSMSKQWADIRIGSFNLSFPKPRIPRLLGAAVSLSQPNSVYPNVSIDVPIEVDTAVIAAGATASTIPLDTTILPNWATRFASLFREYSICGANLELRLSNVVNPAGIVVAFIDEKSGAAPTAQQGENRPRLDMMVQNMTSVQPYRLKWKPADYLDLQWTITSVNTTDAFLQIFTSVASFFTTATTTGTVLVTGSLAVQFRGFV